LLGVVLNGRATSVPFTAVLNGPQQTTTDNPAACSTSAGPHPRRWQQRPNWLCKQGVVGSSPIISTITTNALLSRGADVPSLG